MNENTSSEVYLLQKLLQLTAVQSQFDIIYKIPNRSAKFYMRKTEKALPDFFTASNNYKMIEINHCLIRSPIGTIEVDIYLHSTSLRGLGYDYGGVIMACNHGYQKIRYNVYQMDNISFYFTVMGDPLKKIDLTGQEFYDNFHSGPWNDQTLLPEVTPYTFMIEMTLYY